MSVIMTAGKKYSTSQAKKKPKAVARVPSETEEPGPPYSNDKTSVWYWVLDGQVTTVMFDKVKREVWCNGFLLETYDGFIEGQEDDYQFGGYGDDQEILDFSIFVAQTQTSHQGRLIRLAESDARGFVTHQLMVDEYLIPEHVANPEEAGLAGTYQTN